RDLEDGKADTSANTLIGRGGNDTLVGSSGIDPAVYTTNLSASNVSSSGGQWTVTTGGSEGTDQLVNVEQVVDNGGAPSAHHFLLVGNGGYATIQAAVDAA